MTAQLTGKSKQAQPDLPDSFSLGHVHLKVQDLAAAIEFYSQMFGLSVTGRVTGVVFLSGSSTHHEIALQQVPLERAPDDRRRAGLYHVAFEVPDEEAFRTFLERLDGLRVAHAAVDHGISWAVYFSDPSGNGLEVYVDRRSQHPDQSAWSGYSRRLTIDAVDHWLSLR